MPTLTANKFSKIMCLVAMECPPKLKKLYFKWASSITDSESLKRRSEENDELRLIKQAMSDAKNQKEAEKIFETCEEHKIEIIAHNDQRYPQKLKSIAQPPVVLFCKGQSENLLRLDQTLGIVGSRKADKFGCETAEDFSKSMAKRKVCIISGLAYGVDGFAHKGAVESGVQFPTIAVLGNGLKTVYPPRHENLADQILSTGGLLISQFKPTEIPYQSNFLNRNRIIAGLSDSILVIQAPERSGSLATARYALEEGRDVLVIPGAINDPRYTGSLKMIQSGAYLITSLEDIIEFYPTTSQFESTNEPTVSSLSSDAMEVIKLFQHETSLHIEQITLHHSNPTTISSAILELEMSGIISQDPGNLIRLVKRS